MSIIGRSTYFKTYRQGASRFLSSPRIGPRAHTASVCDRSGLPDRIGNRFLGRTLQHSAVRFAESSDFLQPNFNQLKRAAGAEEVSSGPQITLMPAQGANALNIRLMRERDGGSHTGTGSESLMNAPATVYFESDDVMVGTGVAIGGYNGRLSEVAFLVDVRRIKNSEQASKIIEKITEKFEERRRALGTYFFNWQFYGHELEEKEFKRSVLELSEQVAELRFAPPVSSGIEDFRSQIRARREAVSREMRLIQAEQRLGTDPENALALALLQGHENYLNKLVGKLNAFQKAVDGLRELEERYHEKYGALTNAGALVSDPAQNTELLLLGHQIVAARPKVRKFTEDFRKQFLFLDDQTPRVIESLDVERSLRKIQRDIEAFERSKPKYTPNPIQQARGRLLFNQVAVRVLESESESAVGSPMLKHYQAALKAERDNLGPGLMQNVEDENFLDNVQMPTIPDVFDVHLLVKWADAVSELLNSLSTIPNWTESFVLAVESLLQQLLAKLIPDATQLAREAEEISNLIKVSVENQNGDRIEEVLFGAIPIQKYIYQANGFIVRSRQGHYAFERELWILIHSLNPNRASAHI